MNNIKISIITVTYNSQSYLEQTIKSVIEQDYPDIEYIIIDGGSTDKTLDIIKKYQDRIAYFLSEPDKNMYDAINKGIRVATGDYIAILNSDDFYVNDTVITNVVHFIKKYKGKNKGVYGNLLKVSSDGALIRKRRCLQVSFKELLFSQKLSFVGHATLFISKECYDNVGLYDCENFNYAADYDFVLRSFRKYKIKYINLDIFNFREHQESITSSGKITLENIHVLEKNGYYNYLIIIRFFFYYYTWARFIFLNFRYLLNKT